MLTSVGCQSSKYQETIEIADMATSMEEREQTRIQEIRESAKADFERHYGEGRFEKDFSHLNAKASEMFEREVISDLESIQDGEYFIVGDVVFFNDSLEEVENGEFDLESITNNTLEHAKECELIIYVFVEDVFEGENSKRTAYFKELATLFIRDTVRNPSIIVKTFDLSLLNEKSSEELVKDEQRDIFLMSAVGDQEIMNFDETFSWWENTDSFRDGIEDLKRKYNEEFIILNPLVQANSGYFVCAPKSNVELAFTDGTRDVRGDRYLNVLAQNLLDKEIEAIIQKYGAQDKIVQYNALNEYEYKKFYTDDVNQISDLVNEETEMDIETTLYYLVTQGEEIDAKIIFDISHDIQALTAELEPIRNVSWVRIFELDESHKKIVLSLLRNKGNTAGIMREPKSLSRLETLDENDADIDAFNYLYTYGTEFDYTLQLFNILSESYSDEFIEKHKRNGKWN